MEADSDENRKSGSKYLQQASYLTFFLTFPA